MSLQETLNPKSGRTERIKVNLDAVYPAANGERSFEEVMAQHRGWLEKIWSKEKRSMPDDDIAAEEPVEEVSQILPEQHDEESGSKDSSSHDLTSQEPTPDVTFNDNSLSQIAESRSIDGKEGKPRRKKTMEVRAETQTGWFHNDRRVRVMN